MLHSPVQRRASARRVRAACRPRRRSRTGRRPCDGEGADARRIGSVDRLPHGCGRDQSRAGVDARATRRRAPVGAQLALAVLARTALFGPRPVGEALARTSELAGRAHGDPLLVAPLKTTQAALEAMRGRFPEARALYAEAHVLFTEFGRIVPLAGARMDWPSSSDLRETSKRPSASSAPASRRQPRSVRKGTSRRSPDCSQRRSSSRESWTRPNMTPS